MSGDAARRLPAAPAAGEAVPLRTATRAWFLISLQTFGGPAGQIAVMQRTLVDERRWIGQRRFLHALNYCMLLWGCWATSRPSHSRSTQAPGRQRKKRSRPGTAREGQDDRDGESATRPGPSSTDHGDLRARPLTACQAS
jgi:hypothetical protein